ncbi:caprin homolog [Chrysoperla carnea]|uniref:caprin homolog n=1 Tax=Chrysoperla carnea TaxID=189513 RepID=UPI001D07644D|nr:caprin homolog [Chrysoperla carnea]
MPSASSVKTEKVASQEVASSESSSKTDQQNTPIRQAIVIIEHKIRNLDKRKAKLETYRELQRAGKDLNQDQKVAVAKYDEVSQTLEFARDLCKQFHNIVTVSEKEAKKLARRRKEELARRQQDLAKIREVLLIQDALSQMGAENVREDFLLGRNGATQIMTEDLQLLDDLYPLVSPKHPCESEEGRPEFAVQVQQAADHLLAVVDARQKEFNGSNYAHVKQIIDTIHSCGYLEKPLVEEEPAVVEGTTPAVEEWNPAEATNTEVEQDFRNVLEHAENVPIIPDDRIPDQMPPMPNFPPVPEQIVQQQAVQVIDHPPPTVGNAAVAGYYQAPVVPAPQPQLRPINEMLETGNFFFLQESELDTPPELLPSQTHQTIPSQTFTNQNFTNVVPPVQPVNAVQVPPPFVTAGAPNLPPPIPMPPSHGSSAVPNITPTPNPPTNTFNSQDFEQYTTSSTKVTTQLDVESNSVVHDHNNGGDWADQSVMLEERHTTHQHHQPSASSRPPRGNVGGSQGGNRNRSAGGGGGGYYQNNYYQNNGYGGNSGGGYKSGGGRQGGGNQRQGGGGGQRSSGPGGNKGGDRGSGQYSRNKPSSQH